MSTALHPAAGFGALSLYSTRIDAFDDHDQAVALAMAAHIAVAPASSRQIEKLDRWMHNRAIVGQTVGIVRERYLDAGQAFAFLQRVSSATTTRVIDVAEHIAERRRIPMLPEAHTGRR